jgi:hypothetical protein
MWGRLPAKVSDLSRSQQSQFELKLAVRALWTLRLNCLRIGCNRIDPTPLTYIDLNHTIAKCPEIDLYNVPRSYNNEGKQISHLAHNFYACLTHIVSGRRWHWWDFTCVWWFALSLTFSKVLLLVVLLLALFKNNIMTVFCKIVTATRYLSRYVLRVYNKPSTSF